MKLFLAVVLMCIGTQMFAQAEFGWGLEAYPNFSNRRLIAQSTVSDNETRELEELETGRFSYAAGLFAQWRGERAGFQTGLRFLDTGYRTARTSLSADDTPPPGATEKRIVYQNRFIEAPAEVQFFHELNEKNDFFFSMGLALAYNISNATKTIYYTGDTSSADSQKADKANFHNISYSFLTGMGWERQVSDGLSFVLQPSFQFWLQALLVETDINRNLYSVGVRVGVKFH